ncbi:phage tail protein [Microbacterium sp. As-52]|uniref:phage tail protein n=1 Tax=Microbacterium sp. As-52 TaxID=3390503 RepID=UPI003CF4DF30
MALTIAEAEVDLTVDASTMPAGVSDKLEVAATPVMHGTGLGLATKLIGGFLAFKGVQVVGDWLMTAVDGGSDLNEALNKSTAVFGAEARTVERWAGSAALNVGMTEGAALTAASSLGDMFTQLGFTSIAASDMSTATVQAAADLGSFNNLETADVADRISAALRGEYDSLQSVIPGINAARVEAEAMAASGKTLAGDLTAQERAQAVLAIVHKDGAAAMGDFARTSDDYANSTKIAQAQLSDLQTEVGTALLPTATDFMTLVRDRIIPAFQGAAGWLTGQRDNITGWGIAAAASVATFTTLNALYPPLNAAWQAYRQGTLIATTAQWALNVAASVNPFVLIITGIALLVGGLVWLATQTTVFQDAWVAVTGWLGEAFTWLWANALEPAIAGIGAAFTWVYESIIMPVVTAIMVYIGLWAAAVTWLWGSVLSPVFAAIGEAFTWVWGNVIQPVIGYVTLALQGWGLIASWLYEAVVRPVVDGMRTSFEWVQRSIIAPLASFLTTSMSTVGDTFRSVFEGVAGFFRTAILMVLDAVRAPVNGIIGMANSAIDGLNSMSVEVPDWVPIVGGSTWGLNLDKLPMLARGSHYAPDAFIAGEAGPELVTRQPLTLGPTITDDEPIRLPEVVTDDPELAGRKLARLFLVA